MDPNSKEGYTVIGGDDDEAIPIEEPPVWIEVDASVANELHHWAREHECETLQDYFVKVIEREEAAQAVTDRLKEEGIL